jgi:hypothetical protein
MKKFALMFVLLFTASVGFSAVAASAAGLVAEGAGKGGSKGAAEVIRAVSTIHTGGLSEHGSGAISPPKLNPASPTLAAFHVLKGEGTTGTRGDHDHGHDHDHGNHGDNGHHGDGNSGKH